MSDIGVLNDAIKACKRYGCIVIDKEYEIDETVILKKPIRLVGTKNGIIRQTAKGLPLIHTPMRDTPGVMQYLRVENLTLQGFGAPCLLLDRACDSCFNNLNLIGGGIELNGCLRCTFMNIYGMPLQGVVPEYFFHLEDLKDQGIACNAHSFSNIQCKGGFLNGFYFNEVMGEGGLSIYNSIFENQEGFGIQIYHSIIPVNLVNITLRNITGKNLIIRLSYPVYMSGINSDDSIYINSGSWVNIQNSNVKKIAIQASCKVLKYNVLEGM